MVMVAEPTWQEVLKRTTKDDKLKELRDKYEHDRDLIDKVMHQLIDIKMELLEAYEKQILLIKHQ